MLYLSEDDVTQLLTMDDALRLVEEGFRAWGTGQALNRPRQRATMPPAGLNLMGAAIAARRVMGFKAYSTGPAGTFFQVWLYDEAGRPLAIMQANRLGQVRTGAASGVATRYMAREDARVLGVYGTGWQAETQVEAVCRVRPIQRVQVFGRDERRRVDFCRRMAARSGIEVVPVQRPEQAAAGADVIVTITNSRTPVLAGSWLQPGVHINAAGSNHAKRRELDPEAVRRADWIAADDVAQAREEAGDLIQLGEPELWDRVVPLAEVIIGARPGRPTLEAVTLFESQGLALQDVIVGHHLYELARERGIGREVDL